MQITRDRLVEQTPSAVAAQLEAVFTQIQQQRMADVPVLNPALAVHATGFRRWNDYWLGVLVTPWFMNVMLLPVAAAEAESVRVGEIRQFVFPSGQYDFVAGHEEGIGDYFSCSLFSPMFEFDSQEVAELTAAEALAALLDEANVDTESSARATEIKQIWKGEKPRPAGTMGADEVAPLPHKTLGERMQAPQSRRDFLRGRIFSDSDTEKTGE